MRFFKVLLSVILFLFYLTFYNSKTSDKKNDIQKQNLPSQEEMDQMQKMFENMSEEDYMNLLDAVFTEYKNSDPEKQKIFAEEMGMTVDQMNAVVKEFDSTVSSALNNENVLLNQSTNNKTENIVEKPTAKKEDLEKNKMLFYINLIDETEKILSNFLSKTTEDIVKEVIYSKENVKILTETETTIYYLRNIKSLLNKIYSNNSTIVINYSDLDLLNNNFQKINNNIKNLVNGINLDELKVSYSKIEEDFLHKYGVKNKDLVEDAILSKIEETTKIIEKIKGDKNIDEKTKLKLIEEKKFVLSLLEDDLNKIELNFEKEDKLRIENLKKQKEIINENVLSLCFELFKIYGEPGKGGLIDSLENFMKKYLAEEYKVSKEREKIIKKQYEDEQKKHKSSVGPLMLDNVPRSRNNDNYKDYDDYNDGGYYDGYNSNGNYDYPNYDEKNEKDPSNGLKDQKEIYGGVKNGNNSEDSFNKNNNKNDKSEKIRNQNNLINNKQNEKEKNKDKKEENNKIEEDLKKLQEFVVLYDQSILKDLEKKSENKENEDSLKNKDDQDENIKKNIFNEISKLLDSFTKKHFEYGLDLKKQAKNDTKELENQEVPLIYEILNKNEEINNLFIEKLKKVYPKIENKKENDIPEFYIKLLKSKNNENENQEIKKSSLQDITVDGLQEGEEEG